MRVLLVSHTCQSLSEGQPKAVFLGRMKAVELMVLTPDRWKHYGRWREADCNGEGSFVLKVGKVRWPWLPGAQFYLHWYPELGKVLREFRPDVIDLWEEPWGLVSAQACWLRNRLLPEAKIVTETEQNIDKRLPPPFEWFRGYTLRHADAAVGRSREAAGMLRRRGFDGPVHVVPNGVDPLLFRRLDRGAWRKYWRVEGFTAGYVGRLVEEKGVADFVEAISRCPPSIQGVITGGGPSRSKLESLIQAKGLGGRVRILGTQSLEALPGLMNAFDVLVLPSRTTARWKEQFGRVIIEAHACGVPVIGSDSGAIPDVVGQGGLIVPESDPGALAAALLEMLNDPARSEGLGSRGFEQVMKACTWEAVAAKMHAIYEEVLNGGRPGIRTGNFVSMT